MVTERNSQESLSPKVDHILRALEFEINRIATEQTQPGWTTWALLGGLATTVWLFSAELKPNLFTATKVLPLFLVFSMVLDVLFNVNTLLSERPPGRQRGARFRLSLFYVSEHRADMLFWVLRSVLLIIIAGQMATEVWWLQVYIVYLFYGIMGVIGAIGLILSFLRLPVPVFSQQTLSIRDRLIAVGFIVALAWSTAGYSAAVISSPGGASSSDVRASFLLVSASYLLWLIARGAKESPILSSLVQVRRELAFGWIDVDTAIRQTDILLAGMHVSDALQEAIQGWVGLFEKISRERRELAQQIDAVQSDFPDNGHEWTTEQRARFKAALDPCIDNIDNLKIASEELKNQYNRFKWRVRWFAALSGETKAVMNDVSEKIRLAYEDARRAGDELAQRFDALAQRLRSDSAGPESSSNPAGGGGEEINGVGRLI